MTEKPNIVLIVLDTVRARQLGIYGRDIDPMPNLTSFSEDAVVYERAYTNAPWTVPAHASLFTGQLPSEHNCHGGHPMFEPDKKSLPVLLSESGYQTIGISNNVWISDHFGFDRGFDTFYKQWQYFRTSEDIGHVLKTSTDVRDRARQFLSGNFFVNVINGLYGKLLYRRSDFGAERTTEDALNVINDTDEPFFLFLNYMEGHAPYQNHAESDAFLSGEVGSDKLTNLSGRSKEYHMGDIKISDEQFEQMEALYDGELRYLDGHLDDLFTALQQDNILDDTMVVVIGDHGENVGDYGLMAHRFSVHDTLLHVPMVVRYPADTDTRLDRATPTDLRALFYELLRIAGTQSAAHVNEPPSHVIAEYVDPSYTPEAKTEGFDFEGSRFNRRYAAVIENDYKCVRDDAGNVKLYEREGRDFEKDGRIISDSKTMDKMLDICPDPAEWKSTEASPKVNQNVADHLEALGYR